MNVIQDAVHEVLRDAGLEEYQSEYRALLRRDWAVRVLDAKGRMIEASPPQVHPRKKADTGALGFHLTYPVTDGTMRPRKWHIVYGEDEDDARLAAAQAVYPELPADVRAELGECP